MHTFNFTATINGVVMEAEIPSNMRLIDLIRNVFELTGTKEGCGEGECGACTVIVDGEIVNSCLTLAIQAKNKEIVTIGGVSKAGQLHMIQESFVEQGAVQCGYCTPGMILATKALLDKKTNPTREEITVALSGNLCRCTGYDKIINAVQVSAKKMAGKNAAGSISDKEQLEVFGSVGRSVIKKDAIEKVIGRTCFAADIKMPGMLYAKVLRSPCVHARLKKIDVSKARSLDGVITILTHEDIPGVNTFGIIVKDEPVLVSDIIRSKGDALAIVAADTEETASKAIDLIEVDYEELPAVFSAEEAMKRGAPIVHGNSNILLSKKLRKGDVGQALEQSDIVITNTYTTQMIEHAYIEPEAGIAYMDGESVVVKVSTQNPHYDRTEVAANLAISLNKVRVIQAATGGGFGGKLDISTQIFLALLAKKTGQPVRLVYSREESFISSSKRHPYTITYTTGATREGLLTAVKVRLVCDTGAYASYGPATLIRSLVHATGPYEVPNVSVDGYCVYTNNPRAGAMRGFGVPQVAFAHESQMDQIGEKLGISPFDIRLKNALHVGSITATGQILNQSAGLIKTINKVKENITEKMIQKNRCNGGPQL
jgi:CO/xanthine dehydrogenase Mo-binding subunit/aerobic-type carbon monoxide dehydrogenase small subunit (CoxS/CutS family)